MGMPDTVQDIKASHGAATLERWKRANADGDFDEREKAEHYAMLRRWYGLEELKRACEQLEGQIRRIPEHAPNKPLSEHLRDLGRVCADIDEQVRPLVREVELRKAA